MNKRIIIFWLSVLATFTILLLPLIIFYNVPIYIIPIAIVYFLPAIYATFGYFYPKTNSNGIVLKIKWDYVIGITYGNLAMGWTIIMWLVLMQIVDGEINDYDPYPGP